MPYFLGSEDHPDPALQRLDHIICRVPDIELFHRYFRDELGFAEAWPIGRFWPEGQTSGIALGGINLEFIQPDQDAPQTAVADTLVFEPTSLEAAKRQFSKLEIATRRFDKLEGSPDLLALRGFEGDDLESPQLICRNLLLESDFAVPMFLCQYGPMLKERLSPHNPRLRSAHGGVLSITLQLEKPGDIERLRRLGYLGSIDLHQAEDSYGRPPVTEIKLQDRAPELKGLDPGFRFT